MSSHKSLVLILLLSWLTIVTVFGEPLITVGTTEVFAGGEATLDITANADLKNVTAAEIVLLFPQKIEQGGISFIPLTATSFTPGPVWETNPLSVGVEQILVDPAGRPIETENRFILSAAQPRKFDGPGLLFQVLVKAHPFLTQTVLFPIKVEKAQIVDDQGKIVPVAWQNGVVRVEGGIFGDVDGDGFLTVADAVQVLRFVIGIQTPTKKQLHYGDVSPVRPDQTFGDGKLTTADALLILRRALKVVETPPPR